MDKRVSISSCFFALFWLSLIEYALEHAMYLLFEASLSAGVYMVIAEVLTRLVTVLELVIPALTSLFVLFSYIDGGARRASRMSLSLVAARVIYLIPHYYMTHIASGYDTPESLVLSLFSTVFILLLYFAEVSLITFIGLLPAYLRAKKLGREPSSLLINDLSIHAPLDIGNLGCAFIATASIAQFIKSVISVTVDVVTALMKYGSAYPAQMVIASLLDYLIAIAMLVVIHLLLTFVKSKIIPSYLNDEEE